MSANYLLSTQPTISSFFSGKCIVQLDNSLRFLFCRKRCRSILRSCCYCSCFSSLWLSPWRLLSLRFCTFCPVTRTTMTYSYLRTWTGLSFFLSFFSSSFSLSSVLPHILYRKKKERIAVSRIRGGPVTPRHSGLLSSWAGVWGGRVEAGKGDEMPLLIFLFEYKFLRLALWSRTR